MKEIPLAIGRYLKKTGERTIGIDAYKLSQKIPGLEDNKAIGLSFLELQVLAPAFERWWTSREVMDMRDLLLYRDEYVEIGSTAFFDVAAKAVTGVGVYSLASLYTRNPAEIAGAIMAAELGLNAGTHIAIDSAVAIKNGLSNMLASRKHRS